jgi:hypothetical protein
MQVAILKSVTPVFRPASCWTNMEKTDKQDAPKDQSSSETESKQDAASPPQATRLTDIPKGVYRFKTHEEADEWERQMLPRHRKS